MGCLPFYTKTFSYRPKDRTNCTSRVLDGAMDGIGTLSPIGKQAERGSSARVLQTLRPMESMTLEWVGA